jgi:hypothetical protein
MNAQMRRPASPGSWTVDEVLDIACAARAAIGMVHVATDPRPTADEVVRYRRRAAACNLRLSVTATGLALRPVERPAVPKTVAAPARAPAALAWLGTHGRSWWSGVAAMREGTR